MSYSAKLLVRDVVTAGPSESILNVVRLMKQKHVGCVVLAEGGKVAGIFTERDLVDRAVPDEADLAKTPVSRYMTPRPTTVESSEPLDRIFEILSRRRFRHVPITEDGRPVGMVSLSDFASVLREVFSQERYVQYFAAYFKESLANAPASSPGRKT